MKKKESAEEQEKRWLAAHYAAIEYMKNMDHAKRPAPPKYVMPISKTRRILRILLLLIIRVMKR